MKNITINRACCTNKAVQKFFFENIFKNTQFRAQNNLFQDIFKIYVHGNSVFLTLHIKYYVAFLNCTSFIFLTHSIELVHLLCF